jgi:hypothetical protein
MTPPSAAQSDEITRLGLVRCSQNLLDRSGDRKFLPPNSSSTSGSGRWGPRARRGFCRLASTERIGTSDPGPEKACSSITVLVEILPQPFARATSRIARM